MRIISGDSSVLRLRLLLTAVLMLWGFHAAAYTGQCHTTQGNPYIGVNFGVKTWRRKRIRLEKSKMNFISGVNRMIIMFPAIAIKTMSEVVYGHSLRILR